MKKWIFVACTVFFSVVAGWAIRISSHEAHTRSFCAYNKVFVEFEEDGKRWGTLMLDWSGKPIPCSEENEPVNNAHTSSIITL